MMSTTGTPIHNSDRIMDKQSQNKIFGIFLILILLTHSSFAKSEYSQNTKNIKFKHLTVEDGLSHHETLFVIQDSQNFMWFGTKNGLNKYDGMNIIPYFHDSGSESIIGNFAHWIEEDRNGALWIATWGDGISRYDLKTDEFTNFYHDKNNPQSLSSNNVWSLFLDRSGFVWAATDDGLSKLNLEANVFVHYRHDPKNSNSLSHNTVSRIREDDQGIIWISTYGGGLNKFDPKTETFTNYKHHEDNPRSLSNNNLWGVFIDSSKQIWTASEKGLNRFDPKTEIFTHYQHDKDDPNSLSSNTVTFIHEDNKGMLWLGTFGGGLNRFDPQKETFVHYRHDSQNPYSLSNDIVMSIYEDTTGTLWVATYGGIDKYDPGEYQFEHYRDDLNNPKDLSSKKVHSIFQDQNGSIWIGTDGGGLNQFNKTRDNVVHYLHDKRDPTSIGDNDVRAIDQDKRGDLWVATHGAGLNRFIPAQKKFVRYPHDPDNHNTPACNPLYDLAVDEKRDVVWIAAYLSGLDKFDIKNKTFTHYPYDPDTPGGIVSYWSTVVLVDSKDFVWVGTEAGLSLFDPDTELFTNFKHNKDDTNSLSANMIQAIYEDRQNNIWIGTSSGMNKFEQGTHSFQLYSEKDGLAGNHVAAITEDNQGYLWISTDKGLSKFNPQDKTFRNYDQHDGLQGNRFLIHSAHKNMAGELFFGGTNGFNAFRPNELTDNSHIPKIVLTDFRLFNQPVTVGEYNALTQHINQTQLISLESEQQVFSFYFTALNYRNSHKNQYAYMMKGFDQDWTFVDSSKRFATYTNLDPGHYSFMVKGSNNDGIWNEKGKAVKIIISPPWWESYWFYFVLVTCFFIILISIIFYIRRLRFEVKERKQAERSLKISEGKYRTLIENAPDLRYRTDMDGVFTFISQSVQKLSGYSAKELLGTNDSNLYVVPDKRVDFKKALMKAGTVENYLAELKRKDGTIWWASTNASFIRDKNGTSIGVEGVTRDVTETRQADQSFQSLVEVTAGHTGQKLFDSAVNKLCTLFQCDYAIIGEIQESKMVQTLSMIADGKIMDNFSYELKGTPCKSVTEKGYCLYEDNITKFFPNDKYLIDLKAQAYVGIPLKGSNKKPLGILCAISRKKLKLPDRAQDIMNILESRLSAEIERIRVDEDNINLEIQLQQSQKMEAIGTLAGGIAHDFNNILGGIIGFTELLEEDIEKIDCPERMHAMVGYVKKGGLRATDLVTQILSFSRSEKGNPAPLDILPIIKETTKLLRASLPSTIEIETSFFSKNIIFADATKIHQIFMNLCTNAGYAMRDKGGILKISLQDVSLSQNSVSIHKNVESDNFLQIIVEDNGSGMDEETKSKILQPFFTTKPKGKGTGMGLWVVQGIVQNMGGFIEIKSKIGIGSSFNIFIPACNEKIIVKSQDPGSKILMHGSESILIVDDEKSLTQLAHMSLSQLGYDVTTFNNSLEALENFKQHNDKYQLLITDMTMPGMTGDVLCKQARRIKPGISVILCTGYSEHLDENSNSELFDAVLKKPILAQSMADTIRKVLDDKKRG